MARQINLTFSSNQLVVVYNNVVSPVISTLSPSPAATITGQVTLQTTVTLPAFSAQTYTIDGGQATNSTGLGYLNLSAGGHTITYCAQDSFGDQECASPVVFTSSTSGAAGADPGPGGGGGGAGAGDSLILLGSGNSTAVNLANISISGSQSWLYGVSYTLTVLTTNASGSPYDPQVVSLDLAGNTTGTASPLVRVGTGRFQRDFTLTQADGDTAMFTATAKENGKIVSALFLVDLHEGNESDKILAGVKNTADGIISRVYHFFADDDLHLLIGVVVGLVLIVLLVAASRK